MYSETKTAQMTNLWTEIEHATACRDGVLAAVSGGDYPNPDVGLVMHDALGWTVGDGNTVHYSTEQ